MKMSDKEWDDFVSAIQRLVARKGHEEGSVASTPARSGLKMNFSPPAGLTAVHRDHVEAIPGSADEKAIQIYADYFRDLERMR